MARQAETVDGRSWDGLSAARFATHLCALPGPAESAAGVIARVYIFRTEVGPAAIVFCLQASRIFRDAGATDMGQKRVGKQREPKALHMSRSTASLYPHGAV